MPGTELAGHHQPRAEAEHQAGADRDEDVDDRRQLRFHAARLKPGRDVLPAFPVEAPIFVVFARERLHDLDGGEHLGDAGEQFAFLPFDVAGGLLDPLRVEVDDQEQHRDDRQPDQREPPVRYRT